MGFHAGGVDVATAFRSRLGVNAIDAAIEAARSGAGLVRAVSYQVVDHVRSGRMTVVLDAFAPPPRPVHLVPVHLVPVHLVYDKQNRLPLKLRALIDFAVPRLRERNAGAVL